MDVITPTPRTQVRRLPKRGVYEKEQIYAILDEAFLCHVAFISDGLPFLIPTTYARLGDTLYIHGSAASRVMRLQPDQLDVCINVTLVDGFVMARSVFHHSINYRSVVVMGKARVVTEPEEKTRALAAFTNAIAQERWEEARQPTEQELKATGVLALPIEEASAKVRTGPPVDDEEDYAIPIWAGVVPIHVSLGEPIDDARLLPGVDPIDSRRFRSGQRAHLPPATE